MNLLDGIIIILVALIAGRGLQAGFLRQAGSMGGFGLGLMLGASVAPVLARLGQGGNARSALAIATVFGAAIILSGLGEYVGTVVGHHVRRSRLGGRVDEAAGAAFGIIIGLFVAWLVAALFLRLALPEWRAQIQSSVLLHTLDRALPPAPDVVARFGRLVAPTGFPSVFTGLEPAPAPPVTGPNAAAINQAAAAGRSATVRIEGIGCGGVVEGSGFVAGPGLIATNAHVVAGIEHPTVIDANGSHAAVTVVFDSSLDFAVLRTSDLAAAPLPLATVDSPRGTVGAVLGFPGGGPFTVSPAAVLERQTAVGRNIYDRGIVRRDIYTLQARVRPGNSGGPLLTPDGVVIGVVFGTSLNRDDVGYALTATEARPRLAQAATSGPVSTGACISE